MKYAHVNALLLMVVFHNSCGQNQTNEPKDNIRFESRDTVIQIKKGSNGSILIASLKGVFRYDGRSFTNLTSKLGYIFSITLLLFSSLGLTEY